MRSVRRSLARAGIALDAALRLLLARALLGSRLRRSVLSEVVGSSAAPSARDRDLLVERWVTRLAGLLWSRSDSACLRRSVALHGVLGRLGAEPELVVGFRRVGSTVAGHAWVVVDGIALFERGNPSARFTPTLRFGVDGRLAEGRQPVD